MFGGHLRRIDALAIDPARAGDDEHDLEAPGRHLRLVRPDDEDEFDDDDRFDDDRFDDGFDADDDAPRRRPRRSAPARGTAPAQRPDARLVGIVAAATTPQMLAAVVAFAGHALVVRDIGVSAFGPLILVQSVATAIVGLGALGAPAFLRSSPDLPLAEASATSRRLGRLQMPALLVAAVASVAAAFALTGSDQLVSAALFAVAAAAAVRNATGAALIERSGDHRSGGAAALGTSVIWLGALLTTIEAGSPTYALPAAAVVAELFRALATRRTIAGIRRSIDAVEPAVSAPLPPLASAVRCTCATMQTSLVIAAGLVVVALLGDEPELGVMAVLVVVFRLVLMLEPAVASLGSSFVRPEHGVRTDRAWRRAARVSDAISVPVAIGAVTAFVIGAPAIGRLVGMGSGAVAAAIGLLLVSAPASQILQIADLALRSDGRHLLGNVVMAMRLIAIGGLGAGGWFLVEDSGGTTGLIALAAAWAFGEWLAVATVVVATGWRPLDLPSIATLVVVAAVGAGLFATDGSEWNPPRVALASVLALVLVATAPRTVAQLRRIDTTAAHHLDRPLATA